MGLPVSLLHLAPRLRHARGEIEATSVTVVREVDNDVADGILGGSLVIFLEPDALMLLEVRVREFAYFFGESNERLPRFPTREVVLLPVVKL